MQEVFHFIQLFTLCLCNSADLNSWADNLVRDVKSALQNTDSEFIPVPDLKQETVKLVGKIPVKLKLLAVDGVLGELSSLRRISDVQISNNQNMSIILPLRLDKVGLHFENCFLSSGSSKAMDELEVKVPVYKPFLLNITILLSDFLGRPSNVGTVDISVEKVTNVEVILAEFCLSDINLKIYEWIKDYLNNVVLTEIKLKMEQVFTQILTKYIA